MGTGPAKWEVRARGQAVGRTGCRSWGGGLAQSSLTARRGGRAGLVQRELPTDPQEVTTGPTNRLLTRCQDPQKPSHTCTHTLPDSELPKGPASRALVSRKRISEWILNPEETCISALGYTSARSRKLGPGAPARTAFHSFIRTTCSSPEVWLQPWDWRAGRGRDRGRAAALSTAAHPTVLGSPGQEELPPWAGAHVGRWC